jgi:hypothetical protein
MAWAAATGGRRKGGDTMMFTGYREFDAYARNLRRTVWARQLEQAAKSISVASHDTTIGDQPVGQGVVTAMPDSARPTAR